MHDDIHSTPIGLLRCLQALAEEAACLRLTRTFAALQDAVEACRAESGLGRSHLMLQSGAALLH